MSGEVLGHDCVGKPVRAGDLVMLLKTRNRPDLEGLLCHAVKARMYKGLHVLVVDYPGGEGLEWGLGFHLVRVVPRGSGSWDHIESVTGWKPGKIRDGELA